MLPIRILTDQAKKKKKKEIKYKSGRQLERGEWRSKKGKKTTMVFIALVFILKIHRSSQGKLFGTRDLEVTDPCIFIGILFFNLI